jgi:SAM-dependent methyltransferase
VIATSTGAPTRPPTQGAPPRLLRLITAPWSWLKFVLGIRRALWVGQTRYKELGAEPLAHALSRRGSGAKEYRVRFADGRRMIIAATRQRHYADLVGPRGLEVYQALSSALRPGMRIVALQTGTGYIGEWLSAVVGPSGAVVALDSDSESVRYARNRYRLDNVAFEPGGTDSLGGETAGAFDAALAICALADDGTAADALRELWRVLGPGGRLVVATELPQAADPTAPASVGEPPLRLAPPALRELVARATAEPEGRAPASVEITACPGYSAVVAQALDPPGDRR